MTQTFIEEKQFDSVEDFLNHVVPWGSDPKLFGYVFRGHSQESYQLVPSALRPNAKADLWKVCGIGYPIEQQSEWSM